MQLYEACATKASNIFIKSCFRNWTVLKCWIENGLCTGDGCLTRADPQRNQFHSINLFLNLNLWCKDLVPQKKKDREKQWMCWILGHWTVLCRKISTIIWSDLFMPWVHIIMANRHNSSLKFPTSNTSTWISIAKECSNSLPISLMGELKKSILVDSKQYTSYWETNFRRLTSTFY